MYYQYQQMRVYQDDYVLTNSFSDLAVALESAKRVKGTCVVVTSVNCGERGTKPRAGVVYDSSAG